MIELILGAIAWRIVEEVDSKSAKKPYDPFKDKEALIALVMLICAVALLTVLSLLVTYSKCHA